METTRERVLLCCTGRKKSLYESCNFQGPCFSHEEKAVYFCRVAAGFIGNRIRKREPPILKGPSSRESRTDSDPLFGPRKWLCFTPIFLGSPSPSCVQSNSLPSPLFPLSFHQPQNQLLIGFCILAPPRCYLCTLSHQSQLPHSRCVPEFRNTRRIIIKRTVPHSPYNAKPLPRLVRFTREVQWNPSASWPARPGETKTCKRR